MYGRFILKLILKLIGRDRAGVLDELARLRARQAPAEADLAAAVRAELERRT